MSLQFTNKNPQEKAVPVQARLKAVDEECTAFVAKVRVPDDAGGNKAQVTVSFTDWKEGGVAAKTFEVTINEAKPKK
jgi:hypothetical protein